MHEASLVQGLLNLVTKTIEEHNLANPTHRVRKVEEIICEMGLIACVEPQTLTSCFELFAEGTLAEGAKLTLNRSPLACRCQTCGKSFELRKRRFVCPACGGDNIQFSGGHGLVLHSLRVDSEE